MDINSESCNQSKVFCILNKMRHTKTIFTIRGILRNEEMAVYDSLASYSGWMFKR